MAKEGSNSFSTLRAKILKMIGGSGSYLLLPVLTTTQRDALTAAEGMLIWNTTTGQVEKYSGSAWGATGVSTFAGLSDVKVVRKTADETINNSSTLQDDDELSLALAANEVWEVILLLRYTADSGTSNLKFAFTYPTGCVHNGVVFFTTTGGSDTVSVVIQTSTTTLGTSAATRGAYARFIVVNGANAGTWQLRWAQNTQTAENTKMQANSCLIAARIS